MQHSIQQLGRPQATQKLPWLLVSLTAILFLSACSSTNDRPLTTFTPTPTGDIHRNEPHSLTKKLITRHPIVNRQSGLLHAQVEVYNKRRFPFGFRYKFVWILDNGFTDETSSNWKTQRIESQGTVALEDISPNPAAVDFRILLKPLE
jgi:uncharacterized protein YcfL